MIFVSILFSQNVYQVQPGSFPLRISMMDGFSAFLSTSREA